MIIRSLNTKPSLKRRLEKKNILKVAGIVLAVFLLLIYLPYRNIKTKANVLRASGRELKAAFERNDITQVKKELKEFTKEYKDFQGASFWIYWAAFIPYVADYKNGVEAGHYLVSAANTTVDAIEPYADLIGFKKGETSFSERPAEERLQTAILTLDKVLNKLDAVSEDVRKAEEHIVKINPNRYPKRIGKTFVRDQIIDYKEQFRAITSLVVDAKPLLRKIPEIFGKDEEKKYLILFQNDKERRATGGFLTSTAIFKIKNGKIATEGSEDIYSLDDSISGHPKAPPEILNYHKAVSTFNIRDSNLSPDFVESVKLFNSLYQKSSKKIDYDGIITLDSKVLVDMLRIYGDTEVNGVKFSANIDKRCDCPQVLYVLFDIVDRPVNYVKTNRKGILGELMRELLFKALGFSPSKYYGKLTQTMYQNLEEKHILLYFTDGSLQDSVEKINFAGRIRPFDGDYLHINNVNFAGAKSNLFVTEEIESKTSIGGGKISRDVTITFKNPYPHSDCNLERGGLCLNATLRNWMRVYVPKGSKLVKFTGSSKPVKTYDSLGKTVFEGFMLVNPKGALKVNVQYTLPSNVPDRDYKLMVQKQPSVDTQTLRVEVNGRELLKTDERAFLRDVIVDTR